MTKTVFDILFLLARCRVHARERDESPGTEMFAEKVISSPIVSTAEEECKEYCVYFYRERKASKHKGFKEASAPPPPVRILSQGERALDLGVR